MANFFQRIVAPASLGYFVILVIGLVILVPRASAQTATHLSGIIEDQSGSVVPGAKLTLTNRATNERLVALSGNDGRFLFEHIFRGDYILRVQADEFRVQEIPVTVTSEPLEIPVKLRIAPEEQRVTVTDSQDRVLPEENADAAKFSSQLFHELPIDAQDVIPVLINFLSPSAAGTEGISFVVNGMELSALDTPTWSIKEITINQNPYSAEFRRPGKARVEVTTRVASHKYFHGGVSYHARNPALGARNFFAEQKTHLDRRLWEGGVGGPLLGNQSTFFLSGLHLNNQEEIVVNVFTPAGHVVKNVPTYQDQTNLLGQLDFYPNGVHTIRVLYALNLQNGRNQDINRFFLPEQKTAEQLHLHRIEILDQAVISNNLLNNLRLIVKRKTQSAGAAADAPKIVVNGAFREGPSPTFRKDEETAAELNDTVSFFRGIHSLRFGGGARAKTFQVFDASNFTGTFEFASLADFKNQKPYVFRQNQGLPNRSFAEYEAYGFFQDELRVTPNLNLLLGLRYDWQSARNDLKDLAPRVALAWAPGNHTTVFRVGAGIFYDSLSSTIIRRARLFEGLGIRELVILDPTYPDPFANLVNPPPSFFRLSPGIRAPYVIDASLGIERQLWRGGYLVVEGQTLRGVHLFRLRNVNAPLPLTGLRPDPNFTNIDQVESSATMRANALNVSFRGQTGKLLHWMAQYTFSHTINDTSGALFLPANNYDLRPEKGRADFDRRHRLSFVGSLNLPAGIRFGAVLAMSTPPPFNITTGADNNRDSTALDRPAGVGRNTGQGPNFVQLDLRFSKAFRFPRPTNRERTSRNLEFSVDAFNVLNRTNFNDFIGVQTSPFFGTANSALPARSIQLSLHYHF